MKSITYFYLNGCPYCKKASQYLSELMEENPQYKNIEIHHIEETENMEYCDLMDYFYVPCFFIDGVNRHEGKVTKEIVQRILNEAME